MRAYGRFVLNKKRKIKAHTKNFIILKGQYQGLCQGCADDAKNKNRHKRKTPETPVAQRRCRRTRASRDVCGALGPPQGRTQRPLPAWPVTGSSRQLCPPRTPCTTAAEALPAGELHAPMLLVPSALKRWLDFVHFARGIRPRSCRGLSDLSGSSRGSINKSQSQGKMPSEGRIDATAEPELEPGPEP